MSSLRPTTMSTMRPTTKNFNSVVMTGRKSVDLSKSVFKKDDLAFSNIAQSLASGKSKPYLLNVQV